MNRSGYSEKYHRPKKNVNERECLFLLFNFLQRFLILLQLLFISRVRLRRQFDGLFFGLDGFFILFHPGAVASFLNVDLSMKYYLFPLGLLVYGVVILMQKIRMRSNPVLVS